MLRSNENGFTLIEVIIVVSIMALISTTIYAIMSQTAESKARVEAQDEIFHRARLTLTRMVSDINGAYLEGQGHQSSDQSVKTIFVGKDAKPYDSILFSSFSHLRLYVDQDESDQCNITYYVEKNEDDEGYVLLRKESKRLEDKPGETGDSYALFENITTLDFDFYDAKSDEWVTDWDTEGMDEKDRLPDAVKITITFMDTLKHEITLTQVALIPMSTPLAF